jgi:hypothetical protein
MSHAVWANTRVDGTALQPSLDCGGWTDPKGMQGAWGDVLATNGTWTDACAVNGDVTPACQDEAPFYCFQQ